MCHSDEDINAIRGFIIIVMLLAFIGVAFLRGGAVLGLATIAIECAMILALDAYDNW